ncbi:MAG: CAP domain-containing protein [Chloroflexota bacterium]
MKKLIRPMLVIAMFASLMGVMLITMNVASTQNLDQFAYLPNVIQNPSLTPTITPTLTPTPTPTATPTCNYTIIDSADEAMEESIENQIQNKRDEDKKSELNVLDEIEHAARKHSQDMATNNFVGHQGTDLGYGPDRLEEVCYEIEEDQEIVWGGTIENAEVLVDSWLEVSAWKRAMLDADIEDFGVGYIKGNEESEFEDYITVSFARRKTTRSDQPAYSDCVISIENDFGKGELRLTNSPLCAETNTR